jgi:hypothetical protein
LPHMDLRASTINHNSYLVLRLRFDRLRPMAQRPFRTFPQRFDLKEMEGPRSASFQQPEDAFQALVGDWALTVDPSAQVTPTVGADGRIDIWIERVIKRPPTLQTAPTPFIMECKWHDESSSRVSKNILGGWARVATVLRKQAANGWPDRYAPWARARGYVYCMSATLSHELSRQDLKAEIEKFFGELPAPHRPPIEWVEVLDWQNLRAAFDELANLRDGWLGVGIDAIQTQATFEAGLTGFRSFLSEATLPFVPPPSTSLLHPRCLLKQLETLANERGLLLVGPGGVGKTRTAFEAARLAAAEGWRVLHALPPAQLTADDIAAAALPATESAPALIIIDYLEQFQALSLDALRRVVGESVRRGGRIAFLGLARPRAAQQHESDWPTFFTRLNFSNDDQRQNAIIESIIRSATPETSRRYGPEAVRAVLGRRPIIALLIAREIERRQRSSGWADISLLLNEARDRPGDLGIWLRSRLQEDGLIAEKPGSTGRFLPDLAEPEPEIVGAAAALAVAPLASWKISPVVTLALDCASTDPRPNAIKDQLIRLGWLERDGDFLRTAHDVVADEVLLQCLFDRQANRFRPRVLPNLLQPSFADPRVFGRLANSLARAVGVLDEDVLNQIERAVNEWISAHVQQLGATLLAGQSDSVGYALGAILGSPLFSDAAIRNWEQLVAPWLNRYGETFEARHLLGRALEIASAHREVLWPPAMAWLGQHGETPEASHILEPVLRGAASEQEAGEAIRAGFTWLDHDEHGTLPEAQFVLAPLLGRDDLGEDASRAIRAGFTWLDHAEHGTLPEAGFVLAPLLGRDDLGEDASRAIRAGFTWLDHAEHGTLPEARFVLGPLLGRDDLGEDASRAIRAGFTWLDHDEHGTLPEARFVLAPLLARDDLGEDASRAIRAGFTWLGHDMQATTAFASHVIPRLLHRSDLTGEEREYAIVAALNWIDSDNNSLTANASHVLKGLMSLGPHPSIEPLRVDRAACAWIRDHWRDNEADFLINRVLRRPVLADAEWRQVAARALRRVKHHTSAEGTADTLCAMLSRADLFRRRSLDYLVRRFLSLSGAGHAQSARLATRARKALSHWVTALALHPPCQLGIALSDLIAYLEKHWDNRYPRSNGYLLSPLLPLVHRSGTSEDKARVEALIVRLLECLRGDASTETAFSLSNIGLLNAGAWSDFETGRSVLARLGIIGKL